LGGVAALFATIHLPGWIAEGGLQASVLPMTVMLFILGLILGAVTRASGSIYLAGAGAPLQQRHRPVVHCLSSTAPRQVWPLRAGRIRLARQPG
jgi:hypothetical protein